MKGMIFLANNYTKKGITEMDNTDLFIAFHWTIVRLTNETNSRRGTTKGTSREYDLIVEEMVKRFKLDTDRLKERDIMEKDI